MTTFRQAWNTVVAELTAQPWDFTDADGTTVTVIPEGLPQGPGEGAVVLRITENHHRAAEAYVTTAQMPDLVASLHADAPAELPGVLATVTTGPGPDGGLVLGVEQYDGVTARAVLPSPVRSHLAAALARAADVARGWEK
ncbi:hypothetical protein [Streptacidiphilus sp. EB103A]|uniref:hypothetical protein n=1 Tax=Streptacidiphilus sp. EB103A TaxID=3156275 RepID=UPI003511BDFD